MPDIQLGSGYKEEQEPCLVPWELMSSAGDIAVDNWLQCDGINTLMPHVYKGLSTEEGGPKSKRNH